MPKGISIHIALNHVDPNHYEGWDGALNACIADAKDMRVLAKKSGFTGNTMLLDEQATAEAVTAALSGAAKKLQKGDILLVTYSGHGGQVEDTNSDEEGDEMDETWVLFNRQLVDDELYDLWGKFKAGVRIFVLSDSCHSGTVTRDVPPFISGGPRRRAMPRTVGKKVEKAHKELYRSIQVAHPSAEKAKVNASVLLISGCMDRQFSMDGPSNGAFTGTLKKVWSGGKFKGSYRTFREKIRSLMSAEQQPNYYFFGRTDATYEAQKPFTI